MNKKGLVVIIINESGLKRVFATKLVVVKNFTILINNGLTAAVKFSLPLSNSGVVNRVNSMLTRIYLFRLDTLLKHTKLTFFPY